VPLLPTAAFAVRQRGGIKVFGIFFKIFGELVLGATKGGNTLDLGHPNVKGALHSVHVGRRSNHAVLAKSRWSTVIAIAVVIFVLSLVLLALFVLLFTLDGAAVIGGVVVY